MDHHIITTRPGGRTWGRKRLIEGEIIVQVPTTHCLRNWMRDNFFLNTDLHMIPGSETYTPDATNFGYGHGTITMAALFYGKRTVASREFQL